MKSDTQLKGLSKLKCNWQCLCPCFGFVLHSFAKSALLQIKLKGNQNNTKPKHGMDAV